MTLEEIIESTEVPLWMAYLEYDDTIILFGGCLN